MRQKIKPAPIYEKKHNAYRLNFTYNGKQYRNSYIPNQYEAFQLQREVNRVVKALKEGFLEIPPDTKIQDFVFTTSKNNFDNEYISQKSLPKSVTLFELLHQYEATLTPPNKAHSTCQTEKVHLRHLKRYLDLQKLGDPILKDMRPLFFEKYKQFRYQEGVRSDTVNKELTTFRTLFQQAVVNAFVSDNIVEKVKRDKSQIPCDRFRTHQEIQNLIKTDGYSTEEIKELRKFQYFTLEEIEKLISLAKGNWIEPVLVTFAYTGIRRGELIKLEWRDIDLSKKLIQVKSQKQSRSQSQSARNIPIHKKLYPIIQKQKEETKGRWVFEGPNGGQLSVFTLSAKFSSLIKDTPFEGVGLHAFRHSIASNLAARGVEQHYIDEILGHQTIAMRKRYQHLFPEKTRNALEMLDRL